MAGLPTTPSRYLVVARSWACIWRRNVSLGSALAQHRLVQLSQLQQREWAGEQPVRVRMLLVPMTQFLDRHRDDRVMVERQTDCLVHGDQADVLLDRHRRWRFEARQQRRGGLPTAPSRDRREWDRRTRAAAGEPSPSTPALSHRHRRTASARVSPSCRKVPGNAHAPFRWVPARRIRSRCNASDPSGTVSRAVSTATEGRGYSASVLPAAST